MVKESVKEKRSIKLCLQVDSMPTKSLVFQFSERPYLGFVRSEGLIGDNFKQLKRFRHFQSLVYCHTKAISFSDLDNDFDHIKHY